MNSAIRDRRGVTSIEYAAILAFLAIMIIGGMASFSNGFKGQMGSLASANKPRGPYNYPDGPITNSSGMIGIVPGGGSCMVGFSACSSYKVGDPPMVAINGNLFNQLQSTSSTDYTTTTYIVPYTPNSFTKATMPNGDTIKIAGSPNAYTPVLSSQIASYPTNNSSYTVTASDLYSGQ